MISAFARRRAGAGLMVLAGFLPALALAHPGHEASDALAGLLHPFTGIDHLLAMFAVGLWAARSGRRAVWTLPIVFPAAMILGVLLAIGGVMLPAIEPMIALSVIVLGVLVAAGVRMPLPASAALVGLFAIFHGYAHAIEAPVAPTLLPYAIGFLAATLVLHLLGIAVGLGSERLVRDGRPTRVLGSLIAAAGTAMLFF